jgi:threonine/homoserine/homoserine lactone efflux protein
MSPELAFILQGVGLGFSAATSPGAFQAYLIHQSLANGWRAGRAASFAPLLSDAPIILLALTVLSRLPPVFLSYLSLAGGLFISYLAWGTWKEWRRTGSTGTDQGIQDAPMPEASRPLQSLWRGALINLFGPGPYLFWGLVIGPIFLAALHTSPWQAAIFLASFYSAMILTLLGLAWTFAWFRRFGPRLVRILTLISILMMLGFGFILLWRGLSPLI